MPIDYVNIAEGIDTGPFGSPHLVILGAGASVAAFGETGDKKGRKLPLMRDFVDVLGLEALLKENGVRNPERNFEEIYSELFDRSDTQELLRELEQRVFDYFSSLVLPDPPTLYDHLALSLREKDVIATFNWDPFLFHACARAAEHVSPPRTIFLHGNVAVGYCMEDKVKGHVGQRCHRCGNLFTPSKLLYPIAKKDYASDPTIKAEWDDMRKALQNAYLLTIFGYGAPSTDVEAVTLMKEAWGSPSQRDLEETEIINTQNEGILLETWKGFIHSDHCQILRSFYDSWLVKHPRRSCEAFWSATMELRPFEDHPLPQDMSYEELLAWLEPYLQAEDAG